MAKVITLSLPVFSLLYLWQSYLLPPGNVLIGARTFPLLIGGLMLVISLILVVAYVVAVWAMTGKPS